MLKLLNRVMRIFGRKDFLNVSSIKKLVTNNVFDISKAKRVLNFTPRYTLTEGLQKTYGT
jgi:nucleoside-diphosphate-sugar epimerase